MFYESNESTSHESMCQQVGSAVFHNNNSDCDLCASLKMLKNSVLGLSKGCLRLAINC